MTALELLAPAKNLECGIAAIEHGADAVYIGAPRFGARAAAGNSVEDIRALCAHARPFGVKVYVTVNTLLYDDELEDTERLVRQLYDAGAAAILVQDMGLLRMQLPPIALHASTQTDNRTAAKVSWLRDQGFRRVVLARELSAAEIADIHREVPEVELEVFVHGALCVSYSGLCYASQHCFGRSANRGECAQFCRMKFDLLSADGRILEQQRHLLSLKDLNQSDHLGALIAAGATSFKIEGRLKDVSYVKNVTAAYSQRLDAYIRQHPADYCRASRGRCQAAFTPNLQKTFNRGFTNYFLGVSRQPDGTLKGRDAAIFSPDTPKAMGEYVGRVKEVRDRSFTVSGTASFANGDGLCYINKVRALEGFRVNRAEGNRLFPQQMPRSLAAGMALYRNNDVEFERQLARSAGSRKVPLTFRLSATADGFSLSAGAISVNLPCEHAEAQKPPRDNIVRQLSRLGGTPYECSGVELAPDFNYFIPSSLLAELRRQLIDRLTTAAQPVPAADAAAPADAPSRPLPPLAPTYLYNVSNRLARQFYADHGMPQVEPAFELKAPPRALLMQCRHCLRYSLGQCKRQHTTLRDPLFLRLGDGRRFRLEFDCHQCQMNIYAED